MVKGLRSIPTVLSDPVRVPSAATSPGISNTPLVGAKLKPKRRTTKVAGDATPHGACGELTPL